MSDIDTEIDTSGLNCPLPVLKARKALVSMEANQRLRLIATDKGANKDIPAFCKMSGNELVEAFEKDGKFYFTIIKG
ncbi:MAG TPA: sulfurtransferase TusA family protein [Methylophaga aminisulfidivorans]|uniref:Sulfurtransferase TusA family protein n=2 Tax=root TaxID=1 RepID=A0A7C2ABF3_9GAMM|nr:sulfurtransferase TusA family protein [Methylophaga aminisulfidivorans]HEC74253.1 sulfurtransferase TusA family protein [Methylophaga aminisulfidivorans]